MVLSSQVCVVESLHTLRLTLGPNTGVWSGLRLLSRFILFNRKLHSYTATDWKICCSLDSYRDVCSWTLGKVRVVSFVARFRLLVLRCCCLLRSSLIILFVGFDESLVFRSLISSSLMFEGVLGERRIPSFIQTRPVNGYRSASNRPCCWALACSCILLLVEVGKIRICGLVLMIRLPAVAGRVVNVRSNNRLQ